MGSKILDSKNETMKAEDFGLETFTPYDKLTLPQAEKLVDFLFRHLEEFGDKKEDIMRSISYAMKERSAEGGFVLVMLDEDKIIGSVVVNCTGMKGYIPENILVYIATHKDYRGKGLGKRLMKAAIRTAEGDIALHVEPDNPAKFLYEKVGFTNKYLEMRYTKNK